VGAERCRDHHHVHRSHGGQRIAQVGVEGGAVDDRRVQDDSGVDGRDKLDKPLVGQPGDAFGVDLPEPADADQDQARRRGNRTRIAGIHR
jgi:hypothetical protein